MAVSQHNPKVENKFLKGEPTSHIQSSVGSFEPHLLRDSGISVREETKQLVMVPNAREIGLSISNASDKEAGASTTMSSTNQKLVVSLNLYN